MTTAEDREALAAEYVLGTLDPIERAQAGALVESDADFAALVRGWERRLGELHAMVDPVEPPMELWDRIRGRLGDSAPAGPLRLPELPQPRDSATMIRTLRGGNVVELTRRLGRWRGAAIASGALAAALAALIVVAAIAPDLLPARMRQLETAEAPSGRFVAVLQREAASPAFVLTVDVERRSFTVRRVADPEPGKSFELWLISNRFPQPRSLGVVDSEFTPTRSLTGLDPAIISNATYAVSLEPEGGSPTGEPTGPVVFQGKLVEALPESSR